MDLTSVPHLLRTLVAEVIRDEVEAAVGAALESTLPEVVRRAQYPEYMSREEAASYIGRSVRSLDTLRSTGTIPFTKRGGRVLLAVSDLDAYLAEGRVPAKHSTTKRYGRAGPPTSL